MEQATLAGSMVGLEPLSRSASATVFICYETVAAMGVSQRIETGNHGHQQRYAGGWSARRLRPVEF